MPRTPIEQTFSLGGLGVTNVAQPISGLDLTSEIQAFMVSNFSSNVNSIWLGDSTVSTLTGTEITPGSAPIFSIFDLRQLYEVQNAGINIYETIACQPYPHPDLIPIICWNPSHWFAITSVAGPVNIGLTFFKNVYS